MTAETYQLEPAVETLLHHWTVRVPTGPCQFGIGTLFLQVEYPFLRYNLFFYVYVLSFYAEARKDGSSGKRSGCWKRSLTIAVES
jgi:hypothetical protein